MPVGDAIVDIARARAMRVEESIVDWDERKKERPRVKSSMHG
jgi:hypothetical protein